MTLDVNRTHLKLILKEVSAGAVHLNLALHDLRGVVESPGQRVSALATRQPRR